MLPAGIIIQRFGPKTMFGLSVFIPGICSMICPLCVRTSSKMMLGNQFIMGMFSGAQYPAFAWYAVHWLPHTEVGFMLAVILIGTPLGSMIQPLVAHPVMSLGRRWANVFYMTGATAIVWAYFWQENIWEFPFQHPYIHVDEMELLEDTTLLNKKSEWNWTWKSNITSLQLWTLVVANLGYSWISTFVDILIPAFYFPYIHNTNSGIFNPSLGCLAMVLVAATILASGVVRDRLVAAHYFHTADIAYIYYSICSVGGSLMLLGLAHRECHRISVFLYYTSAAMCVGVAAIVRVETALNMNPHLAAVNIALTCFPGLIVSPLHIVLGTSLLQGNTFKDWKRLTYLNTVACIIITAVFLKLGKSLISFSPDHLRSYQIRSEDSDQRSPTPSLASEESKELSEGEISETRTIRSEIIEMPLQKRVRFAIDRQVEWAIRPHNKSLNAQDVEDIPGTSTQGRQIEEDIQIISTSLPDRLSLEEKNTKDSLTME
ncbi:sialin-like isoform X2 [Homalodisca vitripennis]|nr:sialin-like isoform X2 [Homalodisca vitripennis]